jgi:hypothetical protein
MSLDILAAVCSKNIFYLGVDHGSQMGCTCAAAHQISDEGFEDTLQEF